MSPENANVFVIEDDESWQRSIKSILERSGHTVVLTARTGKEAVLAIFGSKLSELGVQVAIVDGNLTKGDYSGKDGRVISRIIKKYEPSVKTVGMGGLSVEGVDIDLGKSNVGELGEVVNNL